MTHKIERVFRYLTPLYDLHDRLAGRKIVEPSPIDPYRRIEEEIQHRVSLHLAAVIRDYHYRTVDVKPAHVRTSNGIYAPDYEGIGLVLATERLGKEGQAFIDAQDKARRGILT